MHVFCETGRLLLRRFTEDDEDNLVDLDGDPAVMRYINGGLATPREKVRDEVLPRVMRYDDESVYGRWAAIEKATGEFIGWFGLRPPQGGAEPGVAELGYRLRRSAWGRGYATEGSRALIDKAFGEYGVRRVVANTMTVNTASRRVMEKSGLTYVRTFHEEWPEEIEGTDQGDVEYALERADWARMIAR